MVFPQIFASKPPKLPPLNDPESVESEFEPGDFKSLPPVQTQHELHLVNLVDQRFNESATARRAHEGVWFESLAFYLDNQWVEWAPGRNNLKSLRDPNNPYKIYTVRNKIKPKIKKLVARVTSTKPDASVAPQIDIAEYIDAAKEARAGLAHLDRLFDRQGQIKQLTRYNQTTTTCFLKLYFDPTKRVDVPKYDNQGKVIGSTLSDIGEICEDIVPFTEVYPDPKMKTWDEPGGWLIHAKLRSLEYIREHYERGAWVPGEAPDGNAGIVETRLASVVGDYQRTGTESGKNAAIVKEMWDRNVTEEYPNGRLVTVCNGWLLREDAWPLKYWDEFPFIPYEYERGLGSIWALNAVQSLINPQRDYNRLMSRIQQHTRTAWGKLLVPIGCELAPGSFNSARDDEKVSYNAGPGKPEHVPAPPLPPFLVECLRIDDADIQDISGVHDVSNGSVPPGVTAGNAIELLQESDNTQNADPSDNLASSDMKRAKCEIALMRQHYNEPRLIAMQDVKGGSPDEPRMQAMTFTNLAKGGVVVEQGSATAKSPAARIQQIMDMAGKGMFQLEALPTTIMLLDQMGLERSDQLTERLKAALEVMQQQAQAQKPDPAALAAQQAQAQQQQQETQQVHDAAIQAAKDHDAQVKAQIQGALDAQKAEMQQRHDAELEAAKHTQEMQMTELESRLRIAEMASERNLPPPITGTMDPSAVVDREKELGLDGKLPPAPTPNPGKPKQGA